MNKPSREDVRKKVERLGSLPTIPPTITELLRLMDSEDISLKEIADFISQDQSLSARILKIINSPVYGFPGRISSINQSLVLIGTGALKGMLLGVSIFDIMEKTMVGLWEHSIGTAIAAKIIAAKAGIKEIEDASVAGLIHDIGKVALGVCYPELYKETLNIAKENQIYIFDAEEKILGVNHAEAGSWLARKWNFPFSLVYPIEYHHRPSMKRSSVMVSIAHIADSVIKMMDFGFSGDQFAYRIDKDSLDAVGITTKDFTDIFGEIEMAISDKESFLL